MTLVLDASEKNAQVAFELIGTRLEDIFKLFEDEGVTEVNYNGPGRVFIMRRGERSRVSVPNLTETRVAQVLANLASSMGQEAQASTPTGSVTAKMPGYRFSGILAPVASFGTAFSIRRHNPRVLSVDDYVGFGTFPEHIAVTLAKYVSEGRNILIGGGTDSGKTTFLNALSRLIPTDKRVGTIEDTRELSLIVENWLPLETNAARGVDGRHCLKDLMRQSPDRIICGELRDGVAADFLSATNTGHDGCMATLHCNTAALALERMEDLCLQGNSDWPLVAIQRNLGRSIHVIAQFKKVLDKRLLTELIEVQGFDISKGSYQTTTIFNYKE